MESTKTDGYDLDRALELANPKVTPISPNLEQHIANLWDSTARAARRRHHLARGATMIGSLVGLLSIGAGAAMATGAWAPWALEPASDYTFQLPSGVTCEGRVGDIIANNPQISEVIEDMFIGTDVVADAPVDAWVERYETSNEARKHAELTAQNGEQIGVTTADDAVYLMAVSSAISEAISAELTLRGFDSEDAANSFGIKGQALCEEARE